MMLVPSSGASAEKGSLVLTDIQAIHGTCTEASPMPRTARSQSSRAPARHVSLAGTAGVPAVSAFLHSILELHAHGQEPCREGAREAAIQIHQPALPVADAPRDLARGDEVATICQTCRPWIAADQPRDERRHFSKLVRGLQPHGTLVLSGDDPFAAPLAGTRIDARLVCFGLTPGLDVSASIVHIEPSSMLLAARLGGKNATIELFGAGATHATWALAAAATALTLGISPNTIVTGLERAFVPLGALEQTRAGWPDDVETFRASPESADELAMSLFLLRESGYARTHVVLTVGESTSAEGVAHAIESRADTLILTPAPDTSHQAFEKIDFLRAAFRRPGRVLVEPDATRALARGERLARPGDAIVSVNYASQRESLVVHRETAPRRAS
jgi:hypothetical protein